MAQVSYGTITITDTNDIESITIEYARNQSTSTAPTSGWSTDRPTWQQGYYIWQRARIHKSGTPTSQDTFGTAVCLTGSTGSTGAAGRSLTATETKYAQVAADSTETQVKALAESRWTANVPTYSESLPEYWVRVINTYSNPTETEKIYYKDNGLTSAVTTAASANSTAQAASGKADEAWSKADNAETIATNANTTISDLNQYFWRKKTASTNVPAGSYVTNIPGTTYEANPTQGGFNSLVQATGIFLRNGIDTLSSWTSSALTFNNPSSGNAQLIIGANGTLQSGNYSRGTNSKFANDGTKIDLINGDIITKYFRVSQGLESGLTAGAYIHGTIEAISGTIGNFTISSALYSGSHSAYDTATTGIYIGDTYISGGSGAAWYLKSDGSAKIGEMSLNNGVLTLGSISLSSSGVATIGPWTVVDTSIYKENATFGNSGGMYFGNNGLSISDIFKVTNTGQFMVGNSNSYISFIPTSGELNVCANSIIFSDSNLDVEEVITDMPDSFSDALTNYVAIGESSITDLSNVMSVDSTGLTIQSNIDGLYSIKITSQGLELRKGDSATASIKTVDNSSELVAGNSRLSKIKMSSEIGVGHLAWIAESNGHLSLKAVS